jgi:hypothetical protein
MMGASEVSVARVASAMEEVCAVVGLTLPDLMVVLGAGLTIPDLLHYAQAVDSNRLN